MKVLVTGAAGFIGSNLTRALLERGDTVRCFDNFSTGRRDNLEEIAADIELVEADLRDREAVAKACQGVEAVFHQGAMPSVPRSVDDPITSFEVNAGGTMNVLLGAKDAGARRVVYAASSSAYGNTEELPKTETMRQRPLSPYAADKVHGENLCRVFTETYGLECVGLRYFNIFGPRQRPGSAYAAVIPMFFDAVLDGKSPTVHGDGLQSRDFTYVANAVKANLLAAESKDAPGQVCNVGAGARTNLLELLEMIGKVAGKPVNAEHGPNRAGDVRDSLACLKQSERLLGYRPEVDLETGLKHTLAWFEAHRHEA